MIRKFILNFRIIFIPCEDNNFRPKFLMGRFLTWFLLILVILKLALIFIIIYLPATSIFYELTANLVKNDIVEMTNQERQTLGLSPLKVNPKLETAAYLKAQDMIEKDYFSHQSPSGVTPWYWIKKAGYSYKYAGENLAIGFLDSGEVIEAWNESPSHYQNLVSPNYQEIGVAVLRGNFQGSDVTLVVQLLGSPITGQITPPKTVATAESSKSEETKPSETLQRQEEIIPPERQETLPKETIPEEELENGTVEAEEPETIEVENIQIVMEPTTAQEENLKTKIFGFILSDYPEILDRTIFYFLIIIIVALLLNIFIRFDIQDSNLIFRTIIIIVLFGLLGIFDKEIIIRTIPHNLII